MVLLDAIATRTTPLSIDRDTTSKGRELLRPVQDWRTVIAERSIKGATRMDEEGLEVRGSATQDLTGIERRTGDNRRITAKARTKGSIVRRQPP